jgi:hypothetical protein
MIPSQVPTSLMYIQDAVNALHVIYVTTDMLLLPPSSELRDLLAWSSPTGNGDQHVIPRDLSKSSGL